MLRSLFTFMNWNEEFTLKHNLVIKCFQIKKLPRLDNWIAQDGVRLRIRARGNT